MAGRQAPTRAAWIADALMSALRRGTDDDRVEALKAAGIIDAQGNLTKTYKNWDTKITRAPDADTYAWVAPICAVITGASLTPSPNHRHNRPRPPSLRTARRAVPPSCGSRWAAPASRPTSRAT